MKNWDKILARALDERPPEWLYRAILAKIEAARRFRARTRLALFGGTSFVSLGALFLALRYTADQFSRSNFLQYLSLIPSDGLTMLWNWKELSLSLLESAPSLGITLVLMTFFALLGSMRLLGRYAGETRGTGPRAARFI